MTQHAITYYRASPRLAARIRSAVSESAQSPPMAVPVATVRRVRFRPAYRTLSGIAAAAACLVLGWTLALQVGGFGATGLAHQVVEDHVRSLMVNHLTDVASSDQPGVQPWFSGKVDLAPPVGDYADQGFSLMGGRIDYLGGHTVPALVYRHNEHIINLFVLPEAGADEAPRHLAMRGYALANWRKAGLAYWAVCDMSAAELDKLASLTVASAEPTPAQ